MNRLGLLAPSELSSAQHECFDVMRQYTETNYTDKFIYLDDKTRLVGPFGIQIHHPEVGQAFINFAKTLRTIPGLALEVREVAILGVGSRLGAAYESYAHESLSGFSKEERDMLHNGQCPSHFSQAQKTAFKISLELGKWGPLPKEEWDKAVNDIGLDGATALIHYVGFYCYIATILNGFDAQVPESINQVL